MRIIRLALGIFIMVQGIQTADWLFVIFGGLFTLMPLFNIGCCATAECRTAVPRNHQKIEDTTYEEIK